MYEVEITKLDHQGRGIGKVGEKIIFIPYTLPGDIVKVEIKKDKKKFLEGKIISFIKKSNMHTDTKCPYYEVCGGCQLRHMSYEEQLKFKQNKIKEIINKFVKEDIKINDIVPCDIENNYRNKITLKVVNNKLGFNISNTHEIIPIKSCMLASSKINDIISILNKENLDGISEVMIRNGLYTNETMVNINGKDFKIDLDKLKNNVTSITLQHNEKNNKIINKGNIIENLKNKKYKISNQSFFQVNSGQTIKLYDLVLEKSALTGKENVYDLYCGTGSIGIYVSDKCKKVIGIEIIEDAIKDAKENMKLNNITNCEFYAGDVSKIISKLNEKADVIIVDPPRAGLDNITIQNIFRLTPKKIVYVSCDPVTLARDLNIIKEKYNIIDITPVDMFPQTYHCESIAFLEKK